MSTSKKRLSLILPKDVAEMLAGFSKRDKVSVTAKAIELLKIAIEIEEDAVWEQMASERDTPDAEFISHEEFWKIIAAWKSVRTEPDISLTKLAI